MEEIFTMARVRGYASPLAVWMGVLLLIVAGCQQAAPSTGSAPKADAPKAAAPKEQAAEKPAATTGGSGAPIRIGMIAERSGHVR